MTYYKLIINLCRFPMHCQVAIATICAAPSQPADLQLLEASVVFQQRQRNNSQLSIRCAVSGCWWISARDLPSYGLPQQRQRDGTGRGIRGVDGWMPPSALPPGCSRQCWLEKTGIKVEDPGVIRDGWLGTLSFTFCDKRKGWSVNMGEVCEGMSGEWWWW